MALNKLQIPLRTFTSTTFLETRLVKPPIQVFGTEGRYATALYSAATKKKALETVEKDLKTFQQKLNEDSRLSEFLLSPFVKKGLKAEGISGVCSKLKMSPLTNNLLTTLAENGRHKLVSSVIASFGTIMSAHRGEVICEITTAKPLDAIMNKEVEATLKLFLQKGEKSKISYKVDPAIIGGMIVFIGDKYVDMSMASKMKKYTDIIKAAA